MTRPTADAFGKNRDEDFRFDVIGVGALNLDYIASASSSQVTKRGGGRSLTAQLSQVLGVGEGPLEWGAEKRVDADTIYAALEAVDASSLKVNLGGSAFNAICAIAHTGLGLRLGYVGVSGRMPMPGLSSIRQLELLSVDHQGVQKRDDLLSGICFSFVEDGERTLLTHGGANESMAAYLRSDFEQLVSYLTNARVIHVTSFLDPHTPAELLAALREVKERSPATLISFDPGHVWCTTQMSEMDGLVQLADFLFVNNREFRALGGHQEGEDEMAVADRLLKRAGVESFLIVKKPGGITTFCVDEAGLQRQVYPQVALPDHAIEDATGAGDVFAAGLLSVVTSDRLQVELGALLGMELARHKLRFVGHGGHAQFPTVVRGFIRSLDAGRRAPAEPLGVFIAHGGDSDWLAVKELVEGELGLPAHYFERQTWGSIAVTDAINTNLDNCSFAICVLTAEDLTAEGRRLARQNVVHEIGLFQGRYGFDRVLVLAEDGCDYMPQLAAPYSLIFPHNGIRSTFWRVRRMIKERGLGSAARK
ncbi:MAG TPA: PfkB family carbohydrate kinase [Candidatus Limnocylindrales bacterium]|nr:PfkB family carbohydrate kinase [Candidatus Limnocylindrales bacterium]